jgi:hypothetical protein
MPEPLADLQRRFAAHIRNPELNQAPADVEDRRMEIYRGLFFRNLRNFLSGNFPVLKTLYSDAGWDVLVRDFYTEHSSRTPLFPEIPREFLQYLQDGRGQRNDDPPFMLELAHYEWVELALDLDEAEIEDVAAEPDGDLMAGIPVLSPLAWPLSYSYPVHRIRPDFQPSEPPEQATHLLVYRDRGDQVRFIELNPVSALLLQQLKEDRGLTGLDLLNEVAGALQHPNPDTVLQGGETLLNDLRDRDVILGTRPE